jgi:hypothetical protein
MDPRLLIISAENNLRSNGPADDLYVRGFIDLGKFIELGK